MSNGNVLITQKGLEFILSAHSVGPLIYLKYFIPVYDDRFDNTIRSNGVLSAFSAVADKDILEPYGEKLWRVDQGYTLSDSGKFMISATAYTPESLTDTYQKTSVQTNLLNGKPISNQISATSWELTIDNDPLYNWTSIGGAAVTGTSHKATTTTADYYKIKNYYPVYNDLSVNEIRGSFKCIIDEDTGNIKFNKIALYAVQLDSDGITELEHCFFGEAYLGYSPAIRSNLGQGYNKFEFDIQIDLSGVNATFDDLFYSSSADYWSRSPGGLYYPERIGIGSYNDNTKTIAAALQVKRTQYDIDNDVPLLRLNYDENKYTNICIDSQSYDVTNTDPLLSAMGGDIVFCFSSASSYIGDAIAIRPNIASTYALGTPAYPFRELHLKNKLTSKDTSYVVPLKITNETTNYAVDINNSQVLLGNTNGSIYSTNLDPFGIGLKNIGVNITTTTATNADPRGSFKGGDLWREGHDILIYNTTSNNTESIYMFAGLNINGTYNTIDGATHKNILLEIEENSFPLFCVGNTKLSNNAEIKIGAKGKIGLYGPIELEDIGRINSTSIIRTTVDGLAGTKGDKILFIGAGVLSANTMTDISNTVKNISTGTNTSFDNMLHNDSKLFLIANEIKIDSSIVPIQNNHDSLGTSAKMFSESFIKEAYFGTTEYEFGGNSQSGFHIGVIPAGWTGNNAEFGITKLGINNGDCRVQIGQSGDPINYGYFTDLYATNIGSLSKKVTSGYFTNILAWDSFFKNIGSTTTPVYSGYINDLFTTNIGSTASPVLSGYFSNISATNIISPNGYYEYGRPTTLGSWTPVSSSATCPQHSAVSANFDYNIVGKMLTCIGEIYLSSSDSLAISIESIILNYFNTPPALSDITISKAIGHFYTDKIDITAIDQYGNISNMGNVIIFKCKDFSMTKCDSIKFTFIAKLT